MPNIKYVALEIILDEKEQHDVYKGLLRMVSKEGDNTLISLQTGKNTIVVFNLKYFNILTIEYLGEDYRNMSILTCGKSDQMDGLKLVEKLYGGLLTDGFGMVDDSEVIDVTKFSEIPDYYDVMSDKNKSSAQKTVITKSVPTNSTSAYNYNRPGQIYNEPNRPVYANTVYTKKEPTPTLITRTVGKKPTKSQLAALEEKLDRIIAGTYTPDLPDTPGGVAVEKDDALADADERNYARQYGWCC